MDEEDKVLVLQLVWSHKNIESVSYNNQTLKVRFKSLVNGKISQETKCSKEVGHRLVALLNK